MPEYAATVQARCTYCDETLPLTEKNDGELWHLETHSCYGDQLKQVAFNDDHGLRMTPSAKAASVALEVDITI